MLPVRNPGREGSKPSLLEITKTVLFEFQGRLYVAAVSLNAERSFSIDFPRLENNVNLTISSER